MQLDLSAESATEAIPIIYGNRRYTANPNEPATCPYPDIPPHTFKFHLLLSFHL